MVILNTVFDAFSTEHNMTSGGGIISFEEVFFAGLGGWRPNKDTSWKTIHYRFTDNFSTEEDFIC